jgi:hypothetical protein|tara:strand:- start:984 stop:1160 length:177 start_codon:yes stop_codon:yes gene_type:complete
MTNEDIQKEINRIDVAMQQRQAFLTTSDPQIQRLFGQSEVYKTFLAKEEAVDELQQAD